jgi:hypothetical protein
MRPLTIGCCFLLFATLVAFGQSAADQKPKPGPDVQKLAYYLGTWKGEGEAKSGPLGPGGKLSSSMTCEWFAGEFHLICRGEEHGPTGKRAFLNIKGYDELSKTYTEYSVSDLGESEYNTNGSMDGNKRIFVVDQDVGGKRIKIRYIEEQVSPTLFTYQAEASIDNGPWSAIAKGKYVKVK